MSGGVDSSVLALLLKNKGYEVVDATMLLYDDEKIDGGCLANSSVIDYKRICEKVNIFVDKLPALVYAKIRFRSKEAKAKLKTLKNGKIKLIFDEPQRAVIKRQLVVFYIYVENLVM